MNLVAQTIVNTKSKKKKKKKKVSKKIQESLGIIMTASFRQGASESRK